MTEDEVTASTLSDGLDQQRNEQSTVYSVDKALAIVDCLMRSDGPMTAREIALRIGINRTTAHRLLNTLIHRSWIDRMPDGTGYRVSLQHLVISNLAYDRNDVLGAIRPTLQEAFGPFAGDGPCRRAGPA